MHTWACYRISELINDHKGNLYGGVNWADIVSIRGGEEFLDFDDENTRKMVEERFICQRHTDELDKRWISERLSINIVYRCSHV